MDEHLKILTGKTIRFKHRFFDDNRLPLSHFIAKHDNYALREAALMLDAEFGLAELKNDGQLAGADEKNGAALAAGASAKRRQKSLYARVPMFWRAWAYFGYRYFLRLGFLDGREGFLWDFLQGYWYRVLVDAKIHEIKKLCGADAEKIRQHLAQKGIHF